MICCNPLPPTHCNKGGFDSLDAIKTLQSYGRRSSRAVFYLQHLYTSGWVFIQGAFLAMFPFELLEQARSLLTLATCHSPPPMKTVLCESLSSVCIVGFMYFTELRSCSLTPAQVRKEQVTGRPCKDHDATKWSHFGSSIRPLRGSDLLQCEGRVRKPGGPQWMFCSGTA